MNLRDFKKDVDISVGEFIDDCYYFLQQNPGAAKEEEVYAVVEEAVALYNDLKDKAGDKVEGSPRLYFNDLRKEGGKKLEALYEKLSGIVAKK